MGANGKNQAKVEDCTSNPFLLRGSLSRQKTSPAAGLLYVMTDTKVDGDM